MKEKLPKKYRLRGIERIEDLRRRETHNIKEKLEERRGDKG